MQYINEDKTIITLPVPLGSELYAVYTQCGDFCSMQKRAFDKHFLPVPDGRCDRNMPCHTRNGTIDKIIFSLANIERVLNDFGTWIFATEKEAEERRAEIVKQHRKAMRELGFKMKENGYACHIDPESPEEDEYED